MPADRQISPITIFTPIRWWWAVWLWLSWLFADRSALVKARLWDMGFIHVAHWALVLRRPAASPERPRALLRRPFVLFQSNYDGGAAEYAETFALGCPGASSGCGAAATAFPAHVRRAGSCDYVIRPGAQGARALLRRLSDGHRPQRPLRAGARARPTRRSARRRRGMGDTEFAAAWQRFLTREQRNL